MTLSTPPSWTPPPSSAGELPYRLPINRVGIGIGIGIGCLDALRLSPVSRSLKIGNAVWEQRAWMHFYALNWL